MGERVNFISLFSFQKFCFEWVFPTNRLDDSPKGRRIGLFFKLVGKKLQPDDFWGGVSGWPFLRQAFSLLDEMLEVLGSLELGLC